jgi:hypothetical protein
MRTTIGQQLRALGRYRLPERIEVAGSDFAMERVFKHDFFAVTALYNHTGRSDNPGSRVPQRVVLKMARQGDLLGVPLRWLGQTICRNEIAVLTRLQGIEGVPRLLGGFSDVGLIYEYIEGYSLDERPELPDDFFENLMALLKRIHSREIAYVDMNKRGNILINKNSQPCMIDFQISQYIDWPVWPLNRLGRYILGVLHKADFYHLAKHKRRLQRHLMSPEQLYNSRRVDGWITIHRTLSGPLTKFRRTVLHLLHRKGQLINDDLSGVSPENDPKRWAK